MTLVNLDRESTGLQFLERLVAGDHAGIPIGITLGFKLVEAERGRVVLEGAPDKRSYNLIGTVHGGWSAAVLDTALALSVLSTLDAEQTFTTVDIRINYLRPLTEATGTVRAEGKVLQVGRKLAYSEAKLTDAAGKLISHGTGSCLILPKD